MKIRRGFAGGFYVVFRDEEEADKWRWLFWGILRRSSTCFGGFFNAYHLFW